MEDAFITFCLDLDIIFKHFFPNEMNGKTMRFPQNAFESYSPSVWLNLSTILQFCKLSLALLACIFTQNYNIFAVAITPC